MLASALPLMFAEEADGMLQSRSVKQDTVPDFENFKATAKWVADQLDLPAGTEFSVQGPRVGGSSAPVPPPVPTPPPAPAPPTLSCVGCVATNTPTAETTAAELCKMVQVDNSVIDLKNFVGTQSPKCKITKDHSATLFSSIGLTSTQVLPWFYLDESAHLKLYDLEYKIAGNGGYLWLLPKSKVEATGVHFKDWRRSVSNQKWGTNFTLTRCAITGFSGKKVMQLFSTHSSNGIDDITLNMDTILFMNNSVNAFMQVFERNPRWINVVMHNTYWENSGYLSDVHTGEMTCNSPDDEEDLNLMTCSDKKGSEHNKEGYIVHTTCCGDVKEGGLWVKKSHTECGAKNCNKDRIIAELGFSL